MPLLAADVGGTNTRFCLARLDGNRMHIMQQQTYASADYPRFDLALAAFLAQCDCTDPLDAACIAVAGPVLQQPSEYPTGAYQTGEYYASVTNLPWQISSRALQQQLQLNKVKLINDFTAVCYGIDQLSPQQVDILQQSVSTDLSAHPSALVIGAGTGLGVAHRLWIDDAWSVLPTETGHAGFAPESALQTALLTYLQADNAHVSLENILSGRGFYIIYRFLQQYLGLQPTADIEARLSYENSAQLICEAALAGRDALCQQTLELFVEIYGAAAGNAVLNHYPLHEVYIAGGIATKISTALHSENFINAFTQKGLMSDNLRALPVKLITEERVGLLGALAVAALSVAAQA